MRAIDADKLKTEIKSLKQRVKYSGNYDYMVGYISALSTVEGLIAILEGDTND